MVITSNRFQVNETPDCMGNDTSIITTTTDIIPPTMTSTTQSIMTSSTRTPSTSSQSTTTRTARTTVTGSVLYQTQQTSINGTSNTLNTTDTTKAEIELIYVSEIEVDDEEDQSHQTTSDLLRDGWFIVISIVVICQCCLCLIVAVRCLMMINKRAVEKRECTLRGMEAGIIGIGINENDDNVTPQTQNHQNGVPKP